MLHDSLKTTETFLFDGTVSLTTTVGLGLLFAVLASWLLWRERQALGARWAALFWLLRMTALGVVLWMLSGPVHETVERVTVTQSIAIMADVSQSMDVVDAPDTTDLLRWTLASQIDATPSSLGHCDSAKVALHVASNACAKAVRLLSQHRPLQELRQAVEETDIATQRAQEHCSKLLALLSDNHKDLADRARHMEILLEGPIATACDDLQEAIEERGPSFASQMADILEILENHLEGASRRIERLAQDLAEQLDGDDFLQGEEVQNLSRREKAFNVLNALQENVLKNLSQEVRIRKFQFDSTLMPIAAEHTWSEAANFASNASARTSAAGASLTDLSAVLKQLSEDRVSESTRLVILLTDGNHTAFGAQTPQEIATQISDLPIFAVPIGNQAVVRDLRLHRVEAPATVIVKDSAVIDAMVTAIDCDGLATEVILRHDGQEIDRKSITFTGDRVDHRVQFNVSAQQVGWQDYELTVESLVDEENVANNVMSVGWEVVQDKFRVLLVDRTSHWEFRYLQQLFRRDSHVECDELLFYPRLRGTGEMAVFPRLPQRVEDWALYDVVILGDLNPKQFSQASQETLIEYVRQQHGHLIVLGGREHMPSDYQGKPLMELLPVTEAPYPLGSEDAEGYTLRLTDEGRRHSALAIENSPQASEAAWLDVYRKKPIFHLSEYCYPKPAARTLLRAVPTRMSTVVQNKSAMEDLPAFLCWHQVGSGRVVYLAASESWKLRFRSQDRRHHRFWGQLLRWITARNLGSGTEMVRMSTDKNRYYPQEPVEVTVWLKDKTGRPLAGQTLQVSARTFENDMASTELIGDPDVAGRYFCSLESLPSGSYEITVTGSIVDELLASTEGSEASDNDKSHVHSMITIDAGDNLEMLDTRCNRLLLEQVAEITGGQVVPPTAIAEVLKLASLSPEVHETVRRIPLWNRWTNLWLVLSCLVVEWIVRKQKGLV